MSKPNAQLLLVGVAQSSSFLEFVESHCHRETDLWEKVLFKCSIIFICRLKVGCYSLNTLMIYGNVSFIVC